MLSDIETMKRKASRIVEKTTSPNGQPAPLSTNKLKNAKVVSKAEIQAEEQRKAEVKSNIEKLNKTEVTQSAPIEQYAQTNETQSRGLLGDYKQSEEDVFEHFRKRKGF